MLIYYFVIYKIFKKYINKIVVLDGGQYYINIDIVKLLDIMFLLKNSLLFGVESLIDITVIDWIWRLERFSLYYNLCSFMYNYRIFIMFEIPLYFSNFSGIGIGSISSIFKSANWLEREIWDLYGLYVYDHPDLRRILTDYGFVGFPLRKDFPLTGYKEIRYDSTYKIIVSEELQLAQEYRAFAFVNPWI